MTRRDWLRLTRAEGWLPKAVIAAAILAALLLLDPLVTDAWRAGESLLEKNAALQSAQARLTRAAAIEKLHADEQLAVAGQLGRFVRWETAQPASAGENAARTLKDWLSGLGVTQSAIRETRRIDEQGAALLRIEVDADMGIESLHALLSNQRNGPLILRLNEMSVEANDAVRPTGLRVRLQYDALLAPPRPEPPREIAKPSRDKSAAPRKDETTRTVERGAKPMPNMAEEKRK